MRIALCQITSGPSPSANLDLVRTGIEQAVADGAEVVLFPEATMACFGVALGELAEPVDGPWASAVRELAERHGVLVVVGMLTPADDGRVRNTMLVTGHGQHLGYDKIHLFDAFGFAESDTVAPGDQPVTVTVGGTVLGIATCYDVRFPGLFQVLADRGASVILLGASWGSGAGKLAQWELLVRARALDSTCWLVACGQADPVASGITPHPSAPTGIGYSTVVDPYGTVFAQLESAPSTLVVDIDPGAVTQARRTIPVLANRRY